MAEFRITSDDDGFDLRKLAAALAESQGWPRDRVSIWENRGGGGVVVTVDDALLTHHEPDPLTLPMHTLSDVHKACELLRRRDPSLRGVDFLALRDEAARFFSAGWSIADLLHALSHRHDGAPWPRGEGYQGIEWLEHRLRSWKTPSGDIRPSVSQETAQLRIVGRAGLPDDIGMPDEAPVAPRRSATPESARAAADDARRLMRAGTRTTSDGLGHRERTAAQITRPGGRRNPGPGDPR
ncbi:hypothetical protein CDO52_21170 [Nocardiopsis gilva YIM 90087]|uniref:Uncharacterized protein n=1 Tax=Nocardiopsis gilva YIM 90087 TaxID=1235441 RepID=A0A223SA25_9ACTN|nr:hypothetical protein [Nocardiopsis gilva]ASU84968.1 hypothetical protein CDO52_21170 [Nocardiopsis gilva YIM 90087]